MSHAGWQQGPQLDLAGARTVVTGGSGFLGRFVVEQLRKSGAREIFVPRSSEYNLIDGEQVRRLIRDQRPDLIVHLAARVGGIGANRENPGSFFYQNAMMGIQLLHEASEARVAKFVGVGTVCAYPKFAPIPFREESLWDGYPEETNAPYGIAKKVLTVQSAGYREQFGFNSVVLYPVNLYGPGDNFDLQSSHVIPAMLRKFEEAKLARQPTVTLWGDGSPTREFFYVEDCARAIVLAAQRYDSSEPVNLGSSEEIAMRDLAAKIGLLTGFEGRVVWDTTKPNGQPRRKLDVTRAQERFGFSATTSFDQGLAKTYEWMKQNRGKPELDVT
ncbi:MAG TPA: GDP-L-fucose synthase [Polyangiaceae bacterium]|nr:GDP-L-fucose synthase [Polyangiaceae bacterium]